MAPRLAHKKSRKGCQRCKARKVKCDEIHPTCSNCDRHGTPCEYGDQANSTTSRDTPNAFSSDQANSSSGASPQAVPSPYSELEALEQVFDPDERRLLELRLLHHYTHIVTFTFPAAYTQRSREMWSIDVVEMAVHHPCVLNAIFALASLHIVSDTRDSSSFYSRDVDRLSVARVLEAPAISFNEIDFAKAHRIYLNLAVRQQREAIAQLGPHNADAVFVTSILLSYQAIKLLPKEGITTYAPPVQWLRMSRAILNVVHISRTFMPEDSVMETINTAGAAAPDFHDMEALYGAKNREPFQALLDFERYPEPALDAETLYTYERTLAYVGSIYRAILDDDAPRMLLRRLTILGLMCTDQYIDLVDQLRPRALAILAHFFAMMKVVDDHWWLRGLADQQVHGIQSIMPAQWQWSMEWPLTILHCGIKAS